MKKIVRLTESDLVRIVKRVINEENTDCSRLQEVKSSMNPGTGLLARGFKPETANWAEKLSKVFKHTNIFEFKGEPQDALSLSSKCNPANKSIDFITFRKGNEAVTYLGVD